MYNLLMKKVPTLINNENQQVQSQQPSPKQIKNYSINQKI